MSPLMQCAECGAEFRESEAARHAERHGFDDGMYEEFWGCPECGGDFDEAAEASGYGSDD